MAKEILDDDLIRELELEEVDFSSVDSILAELGFGTEENMEDDDDLDFLGDFKFQPVIEPDDPDDETFVIPSGKKAAPVSNAAPEEPSPKVKKEKKKKKTAAAPQIPAAESRKEEPKELEPAPFRRRRTSVVGIVAGTFVRTVAAVLCLVLTLPLLGGIFLMAGTGTGASAAGSSSVTILDKYDMYITNEISNALDGILAVEKVYWLSDSDLVAPMPKAENYGSVSSPGELMWLLEEAADLIGDQEMIFNENTPAWEGEVIRYYYDETILVITWKQLIDRVMYTMSEVKIAHPSQFRRFLAGGEFGSDKQYVTTEMAKSVNAVVASSGDFYKYRRNGAVVYEGQLRRFEGKHVDTCFINDEGDLLFAYRGDLTSEAQAEQFVRENGVRFSLAFGPILVDNGVACPPPSYTLGEINDIYARAAICQKGQLHYLMVSACGEDNYQNRHNIATFAKNVESFGVDKAYALDGGQTTVIAMDGQMINDVEFGYQRAISDIIYFATAMPDGG